MNITQKNEQILERALAQLPHEIEPGHDLWGGIATQLPLPARSRQSGARVAMGAIAGCLLGAGVLSLSIDGRLADTRLTSLPDSNVLMTVRSNQLSAYRSRLPLLDPDTRARVQRDLAVIQAAEADLASALKSDPNSAVVSRLYASTVRQEFDFYDTIVRATEPVITRIPI
jgi:hypothetical protein